MNAKLKSWYCPGIEDLSNYSPLQLDNFCLLFRAMVGPADREGSESFDIQVCTPKWALLIHSANNSVNHRIFIPNP
jgi:hypothetical protein